MVQNREEIEIGREWRRDTVGLEVRTNAFRFTPNINIMLAATQSNTIAEVKRTKAE